MAGMFNAILAGWAVVRLTADDRPLKAKLAAQKRAMRVWAGAMAAAGVVAFAKIATAAIKASMEVEVLQRRFKALIGDEKEAAKAFSAVGGSKAAGTFGRLPAFRTASLLQAQGSAANSAELVEQVDLIGEAAARSGADLQRLALAFGQVASAGVLQGDEVRQFNENMVNIRQVIADFTGRTVMQVKKDVSEGLVSFDTFLAAFKKAFGSGSAMDEFAKTTSGKVIKLQAAWNKFLVTMGDELLPHTGAAVEGMTELSDMLGSLVEITAFFVKGPLQDFGDWVKNFELPKGMQKDVDAADKWVAEYLQRQGGAEPKFSTTENVIDNLVARAMQQMGVGVPGSAKYPFSAGLTGKNGRKALIAGPGGLVPGEEGGLKDAVAASVETERKGLITDLKMKQSMKQLRGASLQLLGMGALPGVSQLASTVNAGMNQDALRRMAFGGVARSLLAGIPAPTPSENKVNRMSSTTQLSTVTRGSIAERQYRQNQKLMKESVSIEREQLGELKAIAAKLEPIAGV